MQSIKKVAYTLVIIGALNWGFFGVTGGAYDVIQLIFGSFPMMSNIMYVLVGLSGIFLLMNRHSDCVCSCDSCNTCGSEPSVIQSVAKKDVTTKTKTTEDEQIKITE